MITFPVGNDPSLKDELLLSNAVENNTMNSFPWDFQIPLRTAKSWGTFFGSPFSLKRFTGPFIPTIYHNFFLYCFQELKATCSCRLRSLRCFVELYSCTSNSSSEYVLWNDLLLHSVEQFDMNSSPLSSITTCME